MQVGYKNFAIFDQLVNISRKQYKVAPQLLWKANRKLYPVFRMAQISMTLSDC